MAEITDYEVNLEADITKEHLFALICELNYITSTEADRKLKVGVDKIKSWAKELEGEGYIIIDYSASQDFKLRITRQGIKKFEEIESLWKKEGGVTPEKSENKQVPVSRARQKMRKAVRRLVADVQSNPLLYISLIMSLYLLRLFYMNPRAEALTFLLAAIFMSMALLSYQQKKRNKELYGPSRQHKALSLGPMISLVKQKKKQFVIPVVAVGLVYSIGMIILNPKNMSLYILLAVFCAVTAEITFFPRKTFSIVAKFYLGMMLITSGLVLLLGVASLTETFMGEKARHLDFLFGLGMIILAYINDREFHVSSILKKSKADRIGDISEKV